MNEGIESLGDGDSIAIRNGGLKPEVLDGGSAFIGDGGSIAISGGDPYTT